MSHHTDPGHFVLTPPTPEQQRTAYDPCEKRHTSDGLPSNCWLTLGHRGTCEEANRVRRLLIDEHRNQADLAFAIWLHAEDDA